VAWTVKNGVCTGTGGGKFSPDATCMRAQAVDKDTVLIGEIGLTGELRAVTGIAKRISECEKLGFKRIILPNGNKKGLPQSGLNLCFAQSVREALKLCFE